MPRTTRKIVLVPLVAAALSIAGCSSVIPGTALPAGASGSAAAPGSSAPAATTDDPVAWVDSVCGALLPLTDAASTTPELDPSGSPDKVFDGISSYLGTVSKSAGTAIDSLNAVGPSPVAKGDDLVKQLTTTLTTFKGTADDLKKSIDKVDVNDPSSLSELTTTLGGLDSLQNLPDPSKDLSTDPELEAAAQKAPNCKKIDATTPG
jgi:hypothetical protein